MSNARASSSNSRARASLSAAMISSTQSAPIARLSRICHASSMKSLRSAGIGTAPRAACRSAADPWKYGASVSTDRHVAPAP